MKIHLPRLSTRRRLFLSLLTCVLIPEILCLFALSLLAFKSSNSDSESLNNIQQQIQSQIQSESKQMQGISTEIKKLKKDYRDLNKKLSQEINFKEGLKFVLASEGGISNDPGDKGGLTNLGITHSEYAQYRASHGLAPRSVTQISLLEATDIYKHTYWLDSGCGDTPRRIAISCFDWQVNSNRGMSTLQQVLGVDVDGIAEHQTFNELNYWLSHNKEDKLLHNYFEIREADYRRWGVGTQSVFLHGWIRRAESLKNYLKIQ
ncbi:MAG: glycosyl hydrolase 108 family protein [Nostoc sp.]|uniref:glycoside hydrolase family 108 protein n=1 Tax=Nostoc sp. TaxID=1180 RepID=UPI002FF5643E